MGKTKKIPFDVPKNKLKEMKKEMPRSSLVLIHRKYSERYSYTYVVQFFDGKFNVTEENIELIQEATKIIREYKNKPDSILMEIEDALRPKKLYTNGTN